MQGKSDFFSKKSNHLIDRSIFFDKNLGYLIKKNGTTTDEVAELLGKNPSQVSKYRQGESYPRFDNLVKLASIFEVDLNDFVFVDMQARESNVDEVEVIKEPELKIEEEKPLREMMEELMKRMDKLEGEG